MIALPPPRSIVLLATLFFIFLGIFFNQILCLTTGIPQLSFIDETPLAFFLIVCLVQLVTRRSLHRFAAYLIGAYLLLFLASLTSPYISLSKAALQILIHLRLFVYYYLASIFIPPRLSRMILRLLIVLTMLGVLLNILLQESYNHLFGIAPLYRYGMLRPIGLQLNVNNLAFTLALFVFGYLFTIERPSLFKRRLLASLLGLLFFSILTGSRTILIFAPLMLFSFSKLFRDRMVRFLLYLFIVFMLFLSALALRETEIFQTTRQNIEWIKNARSESYIRGIMIYYGAQLSVEHFPIGTGAATFGSVMSEKSPVYRELGLDQISFFVEMSGVYDSNWATLLGEFGFLGIALFFLLTFLLYRDILARATTTDDTSARIRRYYALMLLWAIWISSVTNPVFMSPYMSAIFVLTLRLDPLYKKSYEDSKITHVTE